MIKGDSIKYRIIYSGRRTLCISIRQGEGVVVRAPYRVSEPEIARFIGQKREWITRHLNKQESRIRPDKGEYFEGDTFLFRGNELKIETAVNDKWNITLCDDRIRIGCPDRSNTKIMNQVLDDWFRKSASKIILSAFEELITRYTSHEFRPSEIKIRQMKTRWGSCSSKGRITINYQLVRLNTAILDYVILHELCHLKHHNHGKEYYSLLSELCPEWKEIRKELKKYHG